MAPPPVRPHIDPLTTTAPDIFKACPTTVTTSSLPDTSNQWYDINLRIVPQSNIPEAGNGVQVITGVKKGTTLGLYLNHPNLPRVTGSRVRNPHNPSVYAVEAHGLVRDAYDPNTGDVSCMVARFNDPLDSSLDNSEFHVHPLRPHLLTVRASKDINAGDFGYIPYGAYFWCNHRYSIDTLAKAIRRYNIDIHDSTEATDGNWRSLPQYPQLSLLFPAPNTVPSSVPTPINVIPQLTLRLFYIPLM